VKLACDQLEDLIAKYFRGSSTVTLSDLSSRLCANCSCCLIQLEDLSRILRTAFENETIAIGDFVEFYSHFGPMESFAGKLSQFRHAKDVFPTLRLAPGNIFEIPIGQKIHAFFNSPVKLVGEFFLCDGRGRYFDNWSDVGLENDDGEFRIGESRFVIPVDFGM
jgi:hypothetical protein